MPTETVRRSFDRRLRWLAPTGNLGDALLLSSVLQAGHERTGEKFGLLRAQPYASLFRGHPAIEQIAAVSVDVGQVPLLRTDYWSFSFASAAGSGRPFDRLSLMIYGELLGPERLWAPIAAEDVRALAGLPFAEAPVVLASGTDAPRKEWPAAHWAQLARELAAYWKGPIVLVCPVPQAPVPGTFNLSGKLNPREVLALLHRAQACVTVDPFVTCGAAMAQLPAVTLFGATSSQRYGFDGQVVLESSSPCPGPCLDESRADCSTPCPKPLHCLSQVRPERVLEVFLEKVLPRLAPGRPLLT